MDQIYFVDILVLSLLQRGGTAMAIEQLPNFSEVVMEGQRNMLAEKLSSKELSDYLCSTFSFLRYLV